MSPFGLQGKTILITGASSGIGRACAVCAASLGASIIATGRRYMALQETILNCEGTGHQIEVGDIADPEFVKKLVEKAGKIDGLVHAAGIAPMCPMGMLSEDHIESVMRTNSVSAESGWGGGVVYCGSKGALSSSVRALSMELAPKGIRVNAVCPSNIRTPLYESGASEMNDEVALKELLKKQPLGLGEPEQVAWPVCFLLGDASSFITGVNMPVDGGYLAH